jgi:MFS family permease
MAVAVTPGHGPGSIPRWRHVALALCMFLITGVFGFLQPFVPLYLEAAGLDKGRIGLVTGVGTGLALLIQPLLGRLSDRIDARRPVMCAAAVVAGCAYLGYRSGDGLLAFVLLTRSAACSWGGWSPRGARGPAPAAARPISGTASGGRSVIS